MTTTLKRVQRVGSSAGVLLDKATCNTLGIQPGAPIIVTTYPDRVEIRRVPLAPDAAAILRDFAPMFARLAK